MAAASDIGANFSQYSGDPSLGGGTLGAVRIDTRPIEDLARYTMLYNKAQYDQRQKDAEAAAKEIADYMAYDLTTSIPKDAKILQDKYEQVLNYVKANPDAINYRNREKWGEYKKLRNELENDLQGAKIRSVMNLSREKEIATETDEQLKKFRQQELDKEINATDIRTPIKYSQQFDISIPDFGKNAGIKVDVTKVGSNQIFQRDFNLFDVSEARRAGAAAELGFNAIDKATTTGQLKTIKANQNFWIKGSEVLNQAIQSTKKTDGTVDETKLIDLPIMKNINDYNRYIEQKREEIAKGLYVDKLGNKITFGAGPFRIEDYQPINWQDGITPSELAVVAQFSDWKGDEFQTKVIQTDDAIQRAHLDAEWARIGIAKKQFDLEENKFKTATTGSEQDKTAALAFAQNLFLDIASKGSIRVKGGGVVLTPDDIRKLGQDQLKYLGIEQPVKRDEDGKITESGGLHPLSLEPDDVIELAPDGTVKVLKGAKFDEKTDRWYGQWDQSRSTSVWNAARNLLNEENVKSGTKERNAYFPIDLRGKAGVIQIDESGGKTTTESSQTTKTPEGTMAEWLATPGWTKERVLEYKKKGLIKVK